MPIFLNRAKKAFTFFSHAVLCDSFRFLGIALDVRSNVDEAVHEWLVEGHRRLSSLLRSRRFFHVRDLTLHYKAPVLSCLEYRTCAITHAADVHLNTLDGVQKGFL